MSIDAVFNGVPDSSVQPSGTARIGVDVNTNQLYVQTPLSDGWQPNAGAGGGGDTIQVNGQPMPDGVAIFNDSDTVTFTGPDGDGNLFAHTVGVITPTTVLSNIAAGSNDYTPFSETSGMTSVVRLSLFASFDVATTSAAVGTLTWHLNGVLKSMVIMSGTGTDNTFAQSAVVVILMDGSTNVNWNLTSTDGTGQVSYTSEVLKQIVN